jgi:hypothetical protein
MPKGTPTIEQRLTEAHVAITNVRASADLQLALSAYGYTPSASGRVNCCALPPKHSISRRSSPTVGCALPPMR